MAKGKTEIRIGIERQLDSRLARLQPTEITSLTDMISKCGVSSISSIFLVDSSRSRNSLDCVSCSHLKYPIICGRWKLDREPL